MVKPMVRVLAQRRGLSLLFSLLILLLVPAWASHGPPVFVLKWGSLGTGDGQFNTPRGVAVDSAGHVYVADTRNHRIQKFDSSGTFLTKWGSSGSGDGQFDFPRGVAVDSAGHVYVADTFNHRIQKFALLADLTVTGAGTGNGTVTATGINCTITGGTTSGDCTESYAAGTVVNLTATPAANSNFGGWSGDCSGTSASTSVTMNADKTCTATFTLVYTLGDVNNDGKINTIDARMAQQHADGVITLTGTQFLAADVDTDSDVDSTDATAIAKKGIGLPTGIPGFAQLPPSPQPSPSQGEGLGLALLPLLVLVLRRSRRVATLLLAVGVLSTLSGCVEFAGLPPPGGPAIYLTSTSMPNGATRTIELRVQELTAQGGLASLQGRITFPAGVAIQSVTGQSGFVVKAICGTVGEPCSSPNELRFSIVKPSAGGVSNGVVLSLAVQASGGSGQVYTLSWAGSTQAPIVLGGETNVEITGFTTGNGQVKVQ